MNKSLSRMRRLAGLLKEADPYIMSSDEADDLDNQDDDARQLREQKITALIARSFKRIGIEVADYDGPKIFYSEDDREATVELDDSEMDIDLLARLKRTGLSERYIVRATSDLALDIVFIVSPALDQTVG